LLPADRYREKLGDELTRIAGIPGRRRQSLEEASFDAWIKLYRPDENTVNSTVSYYLKGSIAALLLDLEIRRRSAGRRALDDAMRLLWQRYGREGHGYPDAAVQPLVEEAAGVPLDDFFARAVRGRDELDLDGPLATVGLRAQVTARLDDDDRPMPWIGANLAQEGERLRVTEALEGSPATAAGVNPGDQIVALDGFRVDKEAFTDRLGARRPGDVVRLTLFRRDELLELPVRLGSTADDAAPKKIEIAMAENPPAEAREAYRAWLGEEWKKEE
jgi:predicted metalloprotease with PDZ domain